MQRFRATSTQLRDERGLTLVELLVAAALGILLMGLVVTLMVTSMRAQPRISDRNAAIQQGRVLEERLTRELRLASGVEAATGGSLTFVTFLHRTTCGSAGSTHVSAIQCRVTYSCSGDVCTRSEGPLSGGTADTDTLVTGISNAASVFTYLPDTSPVQDVNFVGVRLVFPAEEEGEDAITLEDGAALRNQ